MTVLAMMVLPLPAFLLDVLFTFNITLSLVILLAVIYVRRALEFASFPDRAARRNAAAARAQRRLDPHRADQRAHRRARGRQRDRRVRRIRRRRQLCRRHGRVHGIGDHQFRRHHQGRRAHLGGERALHPGRHAGPADGDRRRFERRHHHAGRRDRAPPGDPRGGGLLRRDGRRQQVRARRRDRRHTDRVHQSVRRHRSSAPRSTACRSADAGPHLRAAHDRRRPRRADPGAAAVGRGRDPGHARLQTPRHEPADHGAGPRPAARARRDRRHPRAARRHPRHAEPRVPGRWRRPAASAPIS